jgi:S-DNA-T family DNA segregation ATPase FtsK/SpoIIIE
VSIELRKDGVVDATPSPLRERARAHLIARRVAVTAVARRRAWSTWQVARQLPRTGTLLVAYAPRGLARATTAWARYLRDHDTAELRSHHAAAKETDGYARASQARSANLTARLMVNGTLVLVVVLVVLAWTWPRAFGVLLAALAGFWLIKVIPGREKTDYVWAGALALLVYGLAPRLATQIPPPPAWVWLTIGVLAVGLLGWIGRPKARALVTLPGVEVAGLAPRLTAPMVTAALCQLGNSKMKDPDSIRLLMDVARHGAGYQIDLELPGGVPASFVIEQREEFAGALRRELGTVWPSVGKRHPSHLVIYVGDQPMSTARQAAWPLLVGKPIDIFEPQPLFTDQRGQWVTQGLAYTAWVIGAVPRMGKTVALRILGLVAAFDPRAKLYVFDLKGTGDLSALAQVAHAYSVGDEPEDIEIQLAHMRAVRQEMRKRTKLVRELTLEQNPDRGKITSALASRWPARFGPIVIAVDEVQVWTQELDDKDMREEFIAILRDLVKRGPALGIILIVATQKPDAKSIPSSIADNASARLCLKVNGQVSNDQILGTSSYRDGIRATQFAFSDKGIAYFRGDGAEPLIVRTVNGIDAAMADELAARARALRQAAGLLTGEADDAMDAVVVLDVVADAARALDDRGRPTAHLAELVGWLQELRPDYADLDADELGKRLRNAGAVVRQVKVGGRTTSGVRATDLRKGDGEPGTELANLDEA